MAMHKGKPVGTFGDIAAFSTMYRKAHITGGCGGVVYSRNQELFHRATAYADRGKPRWRTDFDDRNPEQFLFPALNLHANEVGCAIGIASLGRLRETIAKRVAFCEALARCMEGQDIFTLMPIAEGDSPFILPVFVRKMLGEKLDIARRLLTLGVALNPHYRYVASRWPWLQPYLADDFATPNARAAVDASFCLYLNENYGEREAEQIAQALNAVGGKLTSTNLSVES